MKEINGSVAIGTTPAASAVLTLSSTTRGLLLPVMTTTQKNAISSPTDGLWVYDGTLAQNSYSNPTLTPVSTGQTSPTQPPTNDTGIGTVAWTTPGNAQTVNTTDTTATSIGTSAITNYLNCQNFGFAVPSTATITGVVVTINRGASIANKLQDSSVKLIKGGTVQGTSNHTATLWPIARTSEDHGGENNLWGLSLSPSDVNASDFGVAFAATNTDSVARNATVDAVLITVFYTTPGLSPVRSSEVTGYLTGDVSTSNESYVNVTGMSFAMGANETWQFEFWLSTSSSSSSGIKTGINGPSGATTMNVLLSSTTGVTASNANWNTALNDATAFSAINTVAATGYQIYMGSMTTTGTAGTCQLLFQKVPSGTAKILTGSFFRARRME
jgi:hypothetical protein